MNAVNLFLPLNICSGTIGNYSIAEPGEDQSSTAWRAEAREREVCAG